MSEPHRGVIEAFATDHDPGWLAENVILRDQAQERTFHGRAAAGSFLASLFREAFAEARSEVETVLLAGEAAALTFTFRGRQVGTFMGLPPTRRLVAVPMVMVLRLAGATIERVTLYYNAGTLLRQLELGL